MESSARWAGGAGCPSAHAGPRPNKRGGHSLRRVDFGLEGVDLLCDGLDLVAALVGSFRVVFHALDLFFEVALVDLPPGSGLRC